MLLFDPPNSWTLARQHKTWLYSCLLVTILALSAYAATWLTLGVQPRASSLIGLSGGIVAGFLMLYLFSYALRKLPPCKALFTHCKTAFWLRQHVWLGLMTVPLVIVHGARISGWGYLTFSLVVVYFGVIISGIWGIYRQQRVPTRLLEEIPDETIRSQIPDLTEQMRQEAELLVLATCGPPPNDSGAAVIPPTLVNHGAVIRRTAIHANPLTGVLAAMPRQPIPGCEQLRRYFNEIVDPYLRKLSGARSHLFLRAKMDQDFKELHGRLPQEVRPVIEALRDVCERRRQFEEQEDLHVKLHGWISFHLVLSSALVVLLIGHILTAFWYS